MADDTPRGIQHRAGEIREHLALATPLVVGHLGTQLMAIVDAALLGRFSEASLAGAGIGSGILFTITFFGAGVVMGLDTLVPQALGSGRPGLALSLYRSGIRLALALALPLTLIAAISPLLLSPAGVDPAAAHAASRYIWGCLPAITANLLFAAQRSYLQARSITRPLVLVVVIANVVNLVADGVLIFGDEAIVSIGLPGFGVPALGVLGAALSTTIVSIVQALVTGYAARRATDARAEPRPGMMRDIVRLGLPVGGQLVAEAGIFSTTSILAGRLGALSAAAHQLVIALTSFSFSAALGIGAATSVRVGRAVGSGRHGRARRAGFLGVGLGVAVLGVAGVAFVAIPAQLAGLFTDDRDIVAAAVPLLRIAALFQLSDAVQAITAGALRGAGDTRSTLIGNVVGHYGIGLWVAIGLAFGLELGAPGLWWGLSAGLSTVAIALALRFHWLTGRPIPPAI